MDNTKIIKILLSLLTENNNAQSENKPIENDRKSPNIGQYCIVRTWSAGVRFAKVKAIIGAGYQGDVLLLDEARIIYSWSGAKTTYDIAQNGITSGSLSGVLENTTEIIGVIEIIPCTKKTINQFKNFSDKEYKF